VSDPGRASSKCPVKFQRPVAARRITLALARRLLTGRPGDDSGGDNDRGRRDAEAAERGALTRTLIEYTGHHCIILKCAPCSCVLPGGRPAAGQPFRRGRGTVLWTRDLDLVLLAARVLDRRRATQVCVTERDGMYKQRAMDHAWACPTIIARKGYPYVGDHGARRTSS